MKLNLEVQDLQSGSILQKNISLSSFLFIDKLSQIKML